MLVFIYSQCELASNPENRYREDRIRMTTWRLTRVCGQGTLGGKGVERLEDLREVSGAHFVVLL